MTLSTHHCHVAIVGGGICGLWLLATLRAAGYDALLLEKNQLGGAQTLASQGMIHGGIKYALGGFTTPSSETIASMPARWRQCLEGKRLEGKSLEGVGSLDLGGVPVLSEDYYLFSDARLSSKITAFFGSRSLRGRIEPVRQQDYPTAFANEDFKGTLYRLQDIVVDTDALVRRLAEMHADYIYHGSPELEFDDDGRASGLLARGQRIEADTCVLAAGAGNEALSGPIKVPMQLRPLKQVMVKADNLPTVYAHAISAGAGAKPRLTITTHRMRDGGLIWYLGGHLAETGVARSDDAQIAMAQQELADLFPWLDFRDAEWAPLDIDRAEPARPDRSRPDAPHVEHTGNVIVCWPTKLTLTPLVADEVLSLLPVPTASKGLAPLDLPRAAIADAPWERAFG